MSGDKEKPMSPGALMEAPQRVEAVLPLDVAALFEQHHALVFSAAYRVTGSAADAEDVLQTVFLRLVRRDPETALFKSASSYLHRAAVNAAVDLLRSRQSASFTALEDVEPVLPDTSSPNPESAYEDGEI